MREEIRAEIVANVMSVSVAGGDTIGSGDSVVLLESMKWRFQCSAKAEARPGASPFGLAMWCWKGT